MGDRVKSLIKSGFTVGTMDATSGQDSHPNLLREMNVISEPELEIRSISDSLRFVPQHGLEKPRLKCVDTPSKRNAPQKQHKIVGQSSALASVLEAVSRVAPTLATVLIRGETGTGKGLIAETIHDLSAQNRGPLIKVNCAGLTPDLSKARYSDTKRVRSQVRRKPGSGPSKKRTEAPFFSMKSAIFRLNIKAHYSGYWKIARSIEWVRADLFGSIVEL